MPYVGNNLVYVERERETDKVILLQIEFDTKRKLVKAYHTTFPSHFISS